MAIKIKESRFRKITGIGRTFLILIILIILTTNLTACGGNGTEDMSDVSNTSDTLYDSNNTETTADTTENQLYEVSDDEVSNEPTPAPETYEDYMKLAAAGYENEDWEIAHDCYQTAKELDGSRAEVYRGLSDTYLHMGDVIKALDVLDEGIDKCVNKHDIDLLGQRKEYVLAGMVAIGTNATTNRYDDDGYVIYERVWEGDVNGNKKMLKYVYFNEDGEISSTAEHKYDANGNQIEYIYTNHDRDRDINEFNHETWVYDTAGKEIENVKYDVNGNIIERTTHKYNTKGNLVREVVFDENDMSKWSNRIKYDAAGNVIERVHNANGHTVKTVNTYDENGKLILRVKYDASRIEEKIKYEYDENGNEIKEVHHKKPATVGYWSERNLDYWLEYEYDEYGRVIKSGRHDSDGTAIWREYEYDEEGREIKNVRYESDGTVAYWRECEYDESGNEISVKSYNSTGNSDYCIIENKFDENDRKIYYSHEHDGIVSQTWENEYGEDGNIIREILTNYDSDTGKKIYETISKYTYDENGNITRYDFSDHEGKEVKRFKWKKEYDEAGRATGFYLYDNEKTASYKSKTEYDENGRVISYLSYDKKGNVLVRKETEYDTFGKVIKENYYDADGNLIQYYENEYDDFGSLTRQTMYGNGVLKSEKQTSYEYHYVGNIDAEAADYMDNDMTPEEYNRKQRETFIRFLNGEGKVRYYRNEDNVQNGKIVDETITDLIDFNYIREYKITPEYTFLDMTGDGIEELIIFYKGDTERLCVIQCSYGVLKVIHDIDGRVFDAYLVKCNGRAGIYRDCGTQSGMDRNYYYFLDGEGKNEIIIEDDERYDESDEDVKHFYSMYDSDSFEERDITKGEYYDIMSGMVKRLNIDWYKLEVPDYGND